MSSSMGDIAKFTAMQKELEQQQIAGAAYKKMLDCKLMTPEESAALKTVVSNVDKINQMKMRNEAMKNLLPDAGVTGLFGKTAEEKIKMAKRKFLGIEEAKEDEHEATETAKEEKVENENKEVEIEKNDESVKAPTKEEKEEHVEEIKEIKDNKKTEKHANTYNSTPSDQDLFLASLMKDTPQGQYANALAKAHAEAEATKKHYTDAFTRLRHSADNGGFERMLEEAPELADPSHVNNAKKYYKTLSSFAPSLALDPVVAASFVKKINAYGGMDEKMVQGLIASNNDHMKHHSNMMS